MPDLLIELFSEEIPARMQKRASADLKKLITDGLVDTGLTYESAGAFATPRRLALSIEGLPKQSPDTSEERKGPRVDAPQKAVDGFLRATGLTLEQLEKRADKKGDVWFAKIEKPGRAAEEIVAEVLENTIRNFPWPKSMRWGQGPLRWVRPLHSILCILSDEEGANVVPLTIEGIVSGDLTHGHRFMAPDSIKVTSFDDYRAKLKTAKVMLDPIERADHIWADSTILCFAQGFEIVEDKALLAEVSGLVEWPVVLLGDIGADFLDLPPEVLQTSMREHQKFFSVRNPKSRRIEKFAVVANVETPDEGATIIAGNQKVLAARLSDAKFFWENDLRIAAAGMGEWIDALENVTFHNKLGSQADRVKRIAALAREIAPLVGADANEAEAAAKVAKVDLMSEMVYEFPELQGVMGRYYARSAGLSDAVANAAQDHYSPLGPSDDVPTATVSVAVALADKIDTLTGFWAIDEKPTGSKDPFALRRAALGVIRLIYANSVKIGVSSVVRTAFGRYAEEFAAATRLAKAYPNYLRDDGGHVVLDQNGNGRLEDDTLSLAEFHSSGTVLEEVAKGMAYYRRDLSKFSEIVDLANPEQIIEGFEEEYEQDLHRRFSVEDLTADLLAFFHDRLKVYLKEQSIRHDVIDACIAMPNSDDLTLLVKRATALADFLKSDDGENLLQGFKRANNILSQAEAKDGVEYSYGADAKFAREPAEKALFSALEKQSGAISSAIEAEDFASAMGAMASLRAPIDGFFDSVQVNDENDVIRRNRLNLLGQIREICRPVADLTQIEG